MYKKVLARITGANSGESFSDIWKYFWPECVATVVLYAVPIFLDSWWITQACTTKQFAIFGVTNTLFQLVFKVADATATGIMISCGRYNGLGENENVGRTLVTSLWISLSLGLVIALLLCGGAETIYYFYHTPAHEISSYVPYLRFRAISIFFMFCNFPLIGFLRGIKNTKIPMLLFVSGSIVFLLIDYILIFGHYGCSAYGMEGSAIAAIIQHIFIGLGALAYIFFSTVRDYYPIKFLRGFTPSMVKEIINLSWPVIIDKSALAFAGMWLAAIISPLGTTAKASYAVIHMFRRIFILPSVACTTVITFLVSNRIGKHDWVGIKNTTKKGILCSLFFVLMPLAIISYKAHFFISFFDKAHTYTDFAARALPIITAFVVFDILQVILSGALRGSREVKTVMYGRVYPLVFFFVPFSYGTLYLPIDSIFIKFTLIYTSFYISNACMTFYYALKLRAKGSTPKDM